MDIGRKELGLGIQKIRNARAMTQQQLADAVGVSITHVSLLENGQRGISVETLNSIAAALDIPPATLACLGSRPCRSRNRKWGRLMKEFQQLILDVVAADSSSLKG